MDVFITRTISGFVLSQEVSLSETLDHLIVAADEGYITNDILKSFETEYSYCLKLLNGYIQFIKKKKNDELSQ